MAVDPKLLDFSQELLLSELNKSKHRGPVSQLEPLRVMLAEYRFHGVSVVAMHQVVKRAGIKISYSGLIAWVRRHIGEKTGKGSRAEEIVRHAMEMGTYASAHMDTQIRDVVSAPSSCDASISALARASPDLTAMQQSMPARKKTTPKGRTHAATPAGPPQIEQDAPQAALTPEVPLGETLEAPIRTAPEAELTVTPTSPKCGLGQPEVGTQSVHELRAALAQFVSPFARIQQQHNSEGH